jgi:hypothetical protein
MRDFFFFSNALILILNKSYNSSHLKIKGQKMEIFTIDSYVVLAIATVAWATYDMMYSTKNISEINKKTFSKAV